MNVESSPTEAVVRHHLQAFLEQQGVPAIVADYDENAPVTTENRIYRGRQQIAEFFTGFIASLPVKAIERFTLNAFQVERNIAFITWCVGTDIPLGTDTFVVNSGKIVSQTFAMHAMAPRIEPSRSTAGQGGGGAGADARFRRYREPTPSAVATSPISTKPTER